MPGWKGIVGQSFTPDEFDSYCHTLSWTAWRPSFPATMKLHREDPLTTHACPGKNVRKLEVIQQVTDLIVARHAGDHPLKPTP